MATPSAYGSYAASVAVTGTVATHSTYTYGSTNYNAPAVTSAPSSALSTYQYKPEQTDSRYTDYLAKDYSGSGLPTNQQGQTAYDVQRSQIQSDTEATRQSREEALQRQLSAMGVEGSGIALKQNRMMNADIERESGRRLSGVDVESLQAQERRNERLGSQAFEAEQAGLGRDVTREMGYANLNQQDKALAQQAWQFTNKMEFDTWAKTQDLDDKQADRIWQAVENEKGYERDIGLIAQKTLSELTTMDYQSVLDGRAEDRKTTAEYYHAMGEAGKLDQTALARLQESNPTAYMAYKAGEAGKTLIDTERDIELQDRYMNAFITSFDPDSPVFQAALGDFFTKMGVDVPQGTPGTGAVGTGSNLYQLATSPANEVSYSSIVGGNKPGAANSAQYKAVFDQAPEFTAETYKNPDGADSMEFTDIPPKSSYFKHNGKLYYRGTSDPQEVRKSGINSQEFQVYNVTDGRWSFFRSKELE